MAGTTTNINIRMDSNLKAQADALFADLKKWEKQSIRLSLLHDLKKTINKPWNVDWK